MKVGDYVSYKSSLHGNGMAQVIDIINKDNKQVALCELLFNENDKRNKAPYEPIIAFSLNELTLSEGTGINKRMRYR